MSFLVDFQRELRSLTKTLESTLAPINSSISFTVCRGTSRHDVVKDVESTPESIRMIGGYYDTVGCRFMVGEKPTSANVMVGLTPQQVPPILSTSQLLTIVGAERSGKSRVGFFLNLMMLLSRPRSNCLYLVPSYQKQQIIGELIDEYINHLIIRRNENKHEYTLAMGSRIKLFTIAGGQAGIPNEAFLGFSADAITLEEFRQFPHAQQTFHSAFSRTLNTGGRLIVVSSPEAGHYLEDIVINKVLEQDMDVHYLSALDNFFGKSDAKDPDGVFRRAKRIYPTNKYRRDVLGQFVTDGSNDYCEFDKEKHVVSQMPGVPITHLLWQSDFWLRRRPGHENDPAVLPNPNHRMHTILGLDLGKIFSATVIRASLDKTTTPYPHDINIESLHLTVIHELVKRNTNLVDFIDTVLLRTFRNPRDVAIICDPAGMIKNELDGRSMVGTMMKKGFVVFCPPHYPPRQEAVDSVNLRFKLDMLHVMAGCTQTIECLQKFKSDGRRQKELSRDPFGHLPDGLKYVVCMLFPWIDMLKPENRHYLSALSEKYKDDEGLI